MGQKAKYKGKDMTEHKYVNDPWQHHEMMTQDMENNKQIRSTKFLRYLSHYKSPVDLVNNNYKKEVSKKKKKQMEQDAQASFFEQDPKYYENMGDNID